MKQRPRLDQRSLLGSKAELAGHTTLTVEQDVLIGPPGERPWLFTTLVMAGLILGLFGFTSLTTDQPPLYPSSAVSSQSSGQPDPTIEPAASSLIHSAAEPQNADRLETADPAVVPDHKAKERVVRRFYDEVLTHGYEQAMPYLFAGQVTYQACDNSPTTFSAVEFTQDLLADQRHFHGLTYSIEHIIVAGDRVSVGWSAAGQLVDSLDIEPSSGEEMTWSGLTVWQMADGKIVGGQSIDTGSQAIPKRLGVDDSVLILACGSASEPITQLQSLPF